MDFVAQPETVKKAIQASKDRMVPIQGAKYLVNIPDTARIKILERVLKTGKPDLKTLKKVKGE